MQGYFVQAESKVVRLDEYAILKLIVEYWLYEPVLCFQVLVDRHTIENREFFDEIDNWQSCPAVQQFSGSTIVLVRG